MTLIADYKLNDNAANSNVLDSVLNTNATLRQLVDDAAINTADHSVAGKIDNALTMTENYVDIGDISSRGSVKSIAAWIKLSGSAGPRVIFATVKVDGNTTLFVSSSEVLTVGSSWTGTTVFYVDNAVTTAVPDDNKYHFVGMTNTVGLSPTTAVLSSGNGAVDFVGDLDNVMLFDSVLSATQMRSLHRDGAVPFFRSRYSGNSAFRLPRRRFSPNSSF